ncbi:MAG: peptide ABC transporter permease, partial [Brachybacterium sp.]|nr:peptide ABC transporter permease [Brachybacterium sp.]
MNAQQPADHSADLSQDLEPTASLIAATTDRDSAEGPSSHRPISRGRLVWRRLKTKPNFYIGGVMVALIVAFALFGDFFNIYAQGQQDTFNFNSPPSGQHFFGTDAIGVDLYASMTSALRKSLLIGFLAAPTATLIAAIMGSLAGYLGGPFEMFTNWLINLLLVLPVFYVLMIVSPAIADPSNLPAALQWL